MPILTGPGLLLRPPHPSDVAARLALSHYPHIVHMFGGNPGEVAPMTEADAWYELIVAHPLAWVVEHDGRVLGHVRLDGFASHDARASLAIGVFRSGKTGPGHRPADDQACSGLRIW